jgi:hypothetical protein
MLNSADLNAPNQTKLKRARFSPTEDIRLAELIKKWNE